MYLIIISIFLAFCSQVTFMFDLQEVKQEIKIEGFNSIYYFEFGTNFSHPPEKHNFWEMVYVDCGRINAITNGIGHTLEQGQAIFHEPNEIHAHISDNNVANNMIVISFTCDSEIMEYFKGKTFNLDKTSKTLLSLFLGEAKNTLGKIPNEYTNKENLIFLSSVFGSSQLLQCYFTEFLIRLIRTGSFCSEPVQIGDYSRDIANNSLIGLICDYMSDNIYTPLSLKDICEHFYIGKTRLCNIFKENTSQSPKEYYSELKIKEAKKLLREKKYSISQISLMLGYSSIHTFTRAFKKAVGFTPTAYKNTII